VLGILAAGTTQPPVAEGVGYADVTGNCVARLIECARLLGDRARLDQATSLFNWVQTVQGDGSILHSGPDGGEPAFVGDHLAFADAALQHYLATGTYDSIQTGRRVLQQTLAKFQGARPGILNLGLERKAPQLWTVSLPEIYDGYCESTTAQAIRLALDYGRIFPADTELLRFASHGAGLFGPVAQTLGPAGASYMRSSIGVFDDEFFVTVGPKAQQLADEIARRQPFRLSVAAFGEIRMDVQARGAGVYVVRGATIRGPMTAENAIPAVPTFLGPGL
jgi:uncharacterized protein YyaL (SSP411 family)